MLAVLESPTNTVLFIGMSHGLHAPMKPFKHKMREKSRNGVISPLKRRDAPAMTPEAREQQLIAKAERLAEQKMDDGTASPQIIVHYLKLGTTRALLEQELLRTKNDLMTAQRDAVKAQARLETMFEEAVAAFTKYSGENDD